MNLPINFSDKQKALVLACVAIIFLGLGVGLTALKKTPSPTPPVQRIPTPTATPTPVPASLTLEPSTATLKVGDSLTLSIILSSGGLPIDAVDAIISYDPTVFKVEKVTPGKIFAQYPIKQIDNQAGLAQLSGAAAIKEGKITSFSGEDEFGSIRLRALKATDSAKATWDSNSIVASAGKNRLDLGKSLGGEYTISQ